MTLAEIIAHASTNTEFAPINTSNEAYFGSLTDERLTDVIATVAAACQGKAPAEHTHDYAPENHGHTPASLGAAPADHSHNYAAPTHSHNQSEINGLADALAAKAPNSALSGKADLVDGKVPTSQLPGFVDDVLEETSLSNFPTTGESGKIYVALDTNKTYRWSGTGYVEISASIALGETAATAYRGDHGKVAYDHSQNSTVHVTAAQKEAWDSKAAGNHGHSYNDLSDKPTIPTIPSALPANGGNADTVDNKHASDFAASSHNHSASDINSGTLNSSRLPTVPITKGGTGATTAAAALTALGAFPAAGGTITGDTNVQGVLRVNGQQSFYFQTSTNSQTVGTNNATGGTTICCGASADVNVNGAHMKTPTVVPKTSNTYYCGNSNFRWKGIYSNAAVNVSSDERLKRNITPMDGAALAAFIEKLNVVSYNYKDDAEDAKSRIGLIAQDVQRADADIAKFFVDEDDDGMLGLTPADLVFPLIEAFKAQSKRIAELEAKLEGK